MRIIILLIAVSSFVNASVVFAQSCEAIDSYYLGPDIEVTCVDSCLTLTAPDFTDVATCGTYYGVEEIEYAPPYPFTQGTTAINTGDDTYAGNIPIGFIFKFYGNNYATCKLASNGFLTFDQAETAPYNPNGAIPSNALALNAIMAVYSDLNPSVCGNIKYFTTGNPPSRKFVANWNSVCQFSCTSNIVTAQIVLYEGSNSIEIYIDSRPQCSWGNAVVGIQNATGTSGIAPPGFNTGNWTVYQEAWRFTASQPAEGLTFWHEDGEYLGAGSSHDFCTLQTTTVTAEFGILPLGEFCTEYGVSVASAGSSGANNEIGWTLYSENGLPIVSASAPFTDEFCLPNGCYTLDMTDSGNNGWESVGWTITLPDGTTFGPFTIEGGEGTETFCLDSYDGPSPDYDDYDILATDDIVISVVSPNGIFTCDGNCISDLDGDGICDVSLGCTVPIACNFDSLAVVDDGSCEFYCPGCTDITACNFDPLAIQSDGNCEFPVDFYGVDFVDCDGNCLNDADGDGVCDELEIPGCVNPMACDYDPEATESTECDLVSCWGCTYELACNFDPSAIYYDGSCEFGTCAGCTDSSACNFNPTVSEDDGSCVWEDECGVCGGAGPAFGYDCDGACLDENANSVCDLDESGCTNPIACNFDSQAVFDDDSCIILSEVETASYNNGFSSGLQQGAQGGTNEFNEWLSDGVFCGIGTYWDADAQACLPIECIGDLTGDGLRGTADLLEFLSVYETSCY